MNMTSRRFVVIAVVASCHVVAHLAADALADQAGESRPNILWLTAEDLSPHLGCYGDGYARTPNLDALAREGVRYTRAFATAPVCSPARSCLITGMYATSLGTQRLRSQFPVPETVRAFSALLREAGYYCSNNVKTDYNLQDEAAFIADAWDDSSATAHWRNRKPGQPFFAVFNFMTTHQSRTSVWPHEQFEREIGSQLSPDERHDPAAANLPPYYPDIPEARRAWARYHDCITRMDQEAGELLDQLAADGLAEETMVFFYGDHGMGMPRGKRLLHDSGMRVPLLIRIPERWSDWAPAERAAVDNRLVSFVDFAPTVLSLCGVDRPARMQGIPFLGPATGPPRRFAYGARDRVDEVFDLSRSVRDDRWLYIRNFMPHLSWMPPEHFSDGSTFRRLWTRLAAAGQLTGAPLAYTAPHRAREELYDTGNDPHQLENLAQSPSHQEQLAAMRAELRNWMVDSRDVGLLTESQIWQRMNGTPFALARDEAQYPLDRLLAAADLVGRADAWQEQVRLLADADDGIRYWAAVGLNAALQLGSVGLEQIGEPLRGRLSDTSPVVRVEAASALAAAGEPDAALPVLLQVLSTGDRPEDVLHAARGLELLGDKARPAVTEMRQVLERAREHEARSDIWMFIRFSLESALSVLDVTVAPEARTQADRPNILWITSEDNSPYLGCYGDPLALTPNLDRLAAQGVRYRHALANAPVCSTARTTLITGMHACSLGAQHHRSRVRIPDAFRLYPHYLREAGYYCTNNSKTDYNLDSTGEVWDESSPRAHYKNRPPGQPFFAIFNLTVSHEGQVAPPEGKDDGSFRVPPEQVVLPPYHPDTPEIRRDWAHYYDQMTRMDEQAGTLLRELEESGLAEDTIVFYFSDHGGALPRGKRNLHDSGTRVPLIVRMPSKWSRWAPAEPGQWVERLVSFVDFPATLLSLAGAPIPDHFQGSAFLGPRTADPPEYVFLYRGRMDERYDTARAVRDRRFRYIRNGSPHRPWGQHYSYPFEVLPSMRAWHAAFQSGKCSPVEARYWLPKPAEELYDVVADPFEIENLAGDARYAEQLLAMRAALRSELIATRDTGFIPEGMFQRLAGQGTIYAYARSDAYPIERIANLADRATSRDPSVLSDLLVAMDDPHPVIRYWGAVGCLLLQDAAEPARERLLSLLQDDWADIRVVAAEALGFLGAADQGLAALAAIVERGNPHEILAALNALDFMRQAGHVPLAAAQAVVRDLQPGEPAERIVKYLLAN
jgi:N-sulfoglucosamine sulfohydrolase